MEEFVQELNRILLTTHRQGLTGRQLRHLAIACARHLLVRSPFAYTLDVAERLAGEEDVEDDVAISLDHIQGELRGSWRLFAILAQALLQPPPFTLGEAEPIVEFCSRWNIHIPGAMGTSLAKVTLFTSYLRDVTGVPWREALIHPSWLRWNHGTVPAIVRRIHEKRDYHLLPILADALEDAGCDQQDFLTHCRGPGPHVCGCWVMERFLMVRPRFG